MHEKLKAQLTALRLHGIERILDAEIERAEREGVPPTQWLARLLSEEAACRRERSLAYRLDQAQLPWRWTLDSFPFARQPGINRAQIQTLAGLEFLRRNENLLLIGPTGVGKSGVAIGLLREACLNGYRGCFYNAQELLDELYASLADRSSSKLITRLSRMCPLVIDSCCQVGDVDFRAGAASRPTEPPTILNINYSCWRSVIFPVGTIWRTPCSPRYFHDPAGSTDTRALVVSWQISAIGYMRQVIPKTTFGVTCVDCSKCSRTLARSELIRLGRARSCIELSGDTVPAYDCLKIFVGPSTSMLAF